MKTEKEINELIEKNKAMLDIIEQEWGEKLAKELINHKLKYQTLEK